MTTNGEWLFSKPFDEQVAWMNAEHVQQPVADASERITKQAEMLHMPESHESAAMQQIGQVIENTIKRGVYGDTDAQNADSREKLEADVYKAAEDMEMFYNGERFIDTRKIIGWLDRQAAITSHQWESYHNGMMCEWMAKTDELQAITDERWNKYIAEHLRADTLADDLLTANRQREQYRKKLSNVMDAVNEAYSVGS